MKITQEPAFKPIVIELETPAEARNFIALIDQVDAARSSDWTPDKLTKDQIDMLNEISNIFTDRIGFR